MPHTVEPENGICRIHLAETDSTMCFLRNREAAKRSEEFVEVSADFQTAGRGQRGTHWEAERGKNLLFGLRFHPVFLRPDKQFLLSEIQALSVAKALLSFVGNVSIKWPNDIYVHNRKIGGILLEHDLCGTHIATTITGVGLNVNQRKFHSDAPNPVSLFQLTGKETDRENLLTDIRTRFLRYYRILKKGDEETIHREYLSLLYRREGFHPYEDSKSRFMARITGVEPDGTLCMKDEDGQERRYRFKEVKYLISPFTDAD